MLKYLLAILLCFTQMIYAEGKDHPYILILGIAQDGGYPHMGCMKNCCKQGWANDSLKKNVTSIAIVDPDAKKWWLIDATPDIKEQLHQFSILTNGTYPYLPAGIFLTHAHIGHYTGLMELGREVMNTNGLPIYAMARMRNFLETNGPWSQLVKLNNISIKQLYADSAIALTSNVSIRAFVVPHRDEYSETAGYAINTTNKKYLFIPDINKWEGWSRKITERVKSVDIALLDGTFYNNTELPGRKMSEVPHPLIIETMKLFGEEKSTVTKKIYFIHLNHTNPLLWDKNKQAGLKEKGFNIAIQYDRL